MTKPMHMPRKSVLTGGYNTLLLFIEGLHQHRMFLMGSDQTNFMPGLWCPTSASNAGMVPGDLSEDMSANMWQQCLSQLSTRLIIGFVYFLIKKLHQHTWYTSSIQSKAILSSNIKRLSIVICSSFGIRWQDVDSFLCPISQLWVAFYGC